VSTIRNPIEWGLDQLRHASHHTASMGRSVQGDEALEQALPTIRKIDFNDLSLALQKGIDDFKTFRTDVLFLCLIYPLVGILLAWSSFEYRILPLLAPLAFGFALLGPIAAVGLYEMSRRHERGETTGWNDAFSVVRSPRFGAILTLAIVLLLVFLLWLGAAQLIYLATLGPEPPASVSGFIHDVFMTEAGWKMIIIGNIVGLLFAAFVLCISVISFPMLLDRDVGVGIAMATSFRAVQTNPLEMAAWGFIVAGLLFIGMIPLFMGLIVIMPLLGHATWHLYRMVVPR
jgi:uncharacterized membrane protein